MMGYGNQIETRWYETDGPGNQSKNPCPKMKGSSSYLDSFGDHVAGPGCKTGARGSEAGDPACEIGRPCAPNIFALDPIQYPGTFCSRSFDFMPTVMYLIPRTH